ncbi:MAG: hypothetical protein NW223_13740 [Hyphomicrobiaceae bacterium]|nr:hypothetical protein [Hyphomicrobiaceae bacterium]
MLSLAGVIDRFNRWLSLIAIWFGLLASLPSTFNAFFRYSISEIANLAHTVRSLGILDDVLQMAIAATYKAVRKKRFARTLAECEWRLNNRENLAAMTPRLASAAARAKPAPFCSLTMADTGA